MFRGKRLDFASFVSLKKSSIKQSMKSQSSVVTRKLLRCQHTHGGIEILSSQIYDIINRL